jgi:Transposase DDE domain
LEINTFFDNLAIHITKSAFCQARQKIKPLFFQHFFEESVKSYYKHVRSSKNKFKKYRLWACDTSVLSLPDNVSTRELGIHKYRETEIAAVKLSVYFDVMAKIISQVHIFNKSISDLFCAIQSEIANIPFDVISIFDRGYGSTLLAYLHSFHNKMYVIRLRADFSTTVKDFLLSGLSEAWINEKLGENAYRSAKLLGIMLPKNTMITYRLVRIVLSTGEIEVLMTNLSDTFTLENLNYIYKCRWGVEDCFKVLKSNQMLCLFSGYSAHVVLQDIWSNLMFYNLQTISLLVTEKEVAKKNKKRKANPSKNKKKKNKGYKVNRNIALGTLKNSIIALFTCEKSALSALIEKLKTTYINNLELVCDKNPPRGANKLGKRERNSTETNYKRAI